MIRKQKKECTYSILFDFVTFETKITLLLTKPILQLLFYLYCPLF